eukprot:sb/3473215/
MFVCKHNYVYTVQCDRSREQYVDHIWSKNASHDHVCLATAGRTRDRLRRRKNTNKQHATNPGDASPILEPPSVSLADFLRGAALLVLAISLAIVPCGLAAGKPRHSAARNKNNKKATKLQSTIIKLYFTTTSEGAYIRLCIYTVEHQQAQSVTL